MKDEKTKLDRIIEAVKGRLKKLDKKKQAAVLISVMVVMLALNINPLTLLGLVCLIDFLLRKNSAFFT